MDRTTGSLGPRGTRPDEHMDEPRRIQRQARKEERMEMHFRRGEKSLDELPRLAQGQPAFALVCGTDCRHLHPLKAVRRRRHRVQQPEVARDSRRSSPPHPSRARSYQLRALFPRWLLGRRCVAQQPRVCRAHHVRRQMDALEPQVHNPRALSPAFQGYGRRSGSVPPHYTDWVGRFAHRGHLLYLEHAAVGLGWTGRHQSEPRGVQTRHRGVIWVEGAPRNLEVRRTWF